MNLDARADYTGLTITQRASLARSLRRYRDTTVSAARYADLLASTELATVEAEIAEAYRDYLQDKADRYDRLVDGGIHYLEVWANYAGGGDQ
ncbi:MAG TPA: hypothetical protein H9878_04250 [Candidatus Dietzia merdigallinarum]|nr:hypothetical protein [Candidatus Dietzia merdigallinarum]